MNNANLFFLESVLNSLECTTLLVSRKKKKKSHASVSLRSLLTTADAHLAWTKWSLLNDQQRRARTETGPVESRLKPEHIPVETSLPDLKLLLESRVPNIGALASFLNEEEAITSQLSDEVMQLLHTLLPNEEEEMGNK